MASHQQVCGMAAIACPQATCTRPCMSCNPSFLFADFGMFALLSLQATYSEKVFLLGCPHPLPLPALVHLVPIQGIDNFVLASALYKPAACFVHRQCCCLSSGNGSDTCVRCRICQGLVDAVGACVPSLSEIFCFSSFLCSCKLLNCSHQAAMAVTWLWL